MSSNINFNSIDESFPVQGQDNPSQGFRENFRFIKDGLSVAHVEITDIQQYAAFKNQNNNFNSKIIENAILNNISQKFFDNGIVSGDTTVNVQLAQVQKFEFTSDATLNFNNWPTSSGTVDKYYYVKFHLLSNKSETYKIIFGTESKGSNTKIKYQNFELDGNNHFYLSLPISGAEQVVEAWTYDGGVTVFINYIGEFI
jgi:hypothetical protein